jgi:hypothetical protein
LQLHYIALAAGLYPTIQSNPILFAPSIPDYDYDYDIIIPMMMMMMMMMMAATVDWYIIRSSIDSIPSPVCRIESNRPHLLLILQIESIAPHCICILQQSNQSF